MTGVGMAFMVLCLAIHTSVGSLLKSCKIHKGLVLPKIRKTNENLVEDFGIDRWIVCQQSCSVKMYIVDLEVKDYYNKSPTLDNQSFLLEKLSLVKTHLFIGRLM